MGGEEPAPGPIREALGHALGSDPGPLELSHVPGGASRETFQVAAATGRWVLRRDPPGGQSFVPLEVEFDPPHALFESVKAVLG